MFNTNLLVAHDDGTLLDIDIYEMFMGVKVLGITMYFDEDGEGMGLNVVWEATDDDELNEKIVFDFYYNEAYTKRLRDILRGHGFSEFAVNDICGSESGMQEEGIANYDANEIAEEVKAYLHTVTA